jgi:hypothetical protein
MVTCLGARGSNRGDSDFEVLRKKKISKARVRKKPPSWVQRGQQTSRGRLDKGIPLFSSLPSHLSLSPHISSLRSLLRRPLFASNGSSQSHPQHLFPKHQSPTGKQLRKSIEHSPILSRGAAAVRSAVPAVPARFSRTKSQRRPSVLSSRPSRFFSF